MSAAVEAGLHTTRGLAFNSWHFLIILTVAILAMRMITPPRVRAWVLLALNLYFFSQFVSGVTPWLFGAGLVFFTFGIGELRVRVGRALPVFVIPFVILLFWVVLLLLKDPGFLVVANPFHYFPIAIIGISYCLFRCIQYVMDADGLERRDLLTLTNFLTFFPTLLAGPIERFEHFQQYHDGTASPPAVALLPHLHRITRGMVKKFVLADNLMVFGFFVKGPDADWSPLTLWIAVLAQLALLYLDFSGYCDIVIGAAGLMGFPIAENFDRPWLARNVQEFWNRWHITLSHFVRDYFFNPLSRLVYYHVPPGWQFPLIVAIYFAAMVVIALWHGITWGFLVFGLSHGLAIVVLQVLHRLRAARPADGRPRSASVAALRTTAGRVLTYCFVTFTMVVGYCGVEGTAKILRIMMGCSNHVTVAENAR
jgi:alginate O-acetyltransferase complex protein AlgI